MPKLKAMVLKGWEMLRIEKLSIYWEKNSKFGQKNATERFNGTFYILNYQIHYLTITPSTKRIGTSSISVSLMLFALKMNFLSYNVPSIK